MSRCVSLRCIIFETIYPIKNKYMEMERIQISIVIKNKGCLALSLEMDNIFLNVDWLTVGLRNFFSRTDEYVK